MSFLWYIIIGIVAGFAAGRITKGRGFGFFINLIVGIVGGVLGGWLFGLMGISVHESSKIGNLVMATVGAIVLLCIVALFQRNHNQ